jgi:hypothetical protein
MKPQIFGLEFISQPRDPVYYGARGVLLHFHKHGFICNGFSVAAVCHLRVALKQLRNVRQSTSPLIILSGHGEAGSIAIGNESLTANELIVINPGFFKDAWVHLSYCESLAFEKRDQSHLVKAFSLARLTGFKNSPRWKHSFLSDLETVKLYLAQFASEGCKMKE